MNFQTESYFFFFLIISKFLSKIFHIVYILENILFIGVAVIIFNSINLFYSFSLIILF